jgi:hypothetical protein
MTFFEVKSIARTVIDVYGLNTNIDWLIDLILREFNPEDPLEVRRAVLEAKHEWTTVHVWIPTAVVQ